MEKEEEKNFLKQRQEPTQRHGHIKAVSMGGLGSSLVA